MGYAAALGGALLAAASPVRADPPARSFAEIAAPPPVAAGGLDEASAPLRASSAFASPAIGGAAPAGFSSSLVASPGGCAPGAQAACSCPGGGRGTQVCDRAGIRFSACACASVSVQVPGLPPLPNVRPVGVDFRPPPRPRRPRHRSSGLGMLIGGGVSLLVGTGNLVWGIERLRDTRNDPLGIVMIATGGVAMAAGLPLTIVGIAFLASRGLHPDDASLPLRLAYTPTGPAFVF